jgi:hypothetical protein
MANGECQERTISNIKRFGISRLAFAFGIRLWHSPLAFAIRHSPFGIRHSAFVIR